MFGVLIKGQKALTGALRIQNRDSYKSANWFLKKSPLQTQQTSGLDDGDKFLL